MTVNEYCEYMEYYLGVITRRTQFKLNERAQKKLPSISAMQCNKAIHAKIYDIT